MGLSLTPGLAVAGLTTTVSLAAAMTGVQALGPVASHTTHSAVVASAPAHGAPAVVHLTSAGVHATLVANHHLLANNPVTTPPAASTASASPTCTPSQLPSQANGVGRRCVSGPPSSNHGQGKAGGNSSHTPPHPATPAGGSGQPPANSNAGGNGKGHGATGAAATGPSPSATPTGH